MLKIIENKDSPLLSRKELKAEISFEKATPSNAALKSQIAKQLSVDENIIRIRKIDTQFGERRAIVYANIYKKPDMLVKYENKEKKKKDANAPAAPAAIPAAAPAAK